MAARLLVLILAAGPAAAQPPPAECDQTVAASLRVVHEAGRELYRTGDPAGAYRLFQGALLAVKPIVAHRPNAAGVIEDGLTEAAKAAGSPSAQAYRLHQAIDALRAELKKPLPQPAEVAKEKEPAPVPARRPPPSLPTDGPGVYGVVTRDGKPLAGVKVLFYPTKYTKPYDGTTGPEGEYVVSRGVPAGTYTIAFTSVSGVSIPDRFRPGNDSGLSRKVVDGENLFDFDLPAR